MKKHSVFYSIFRLKCPNCHQGDLFKTQSPYSKKFMSMHEHCSHCGLKYEREPSFFYGSMYVAYGYTVAIAVAWLIANYLWLDLTTTGFLIGLGTSLVILSPILFRVSRSTWMNIFISFGKFPHKPIPKEKN